MLQVFRNSAKGNVGKVIVGLIVITFVLFGAESIMSIAGNTAPATVNGDDISELNYQRLLNRQQQELTNQYGAEVATQLANQQYFREQVINTLINQELQSQITEKLKFDVSDEQILKTFAEVPAFQLDGKFDQDMYLNVLSANGFNHQSFIASEKAQTALTQMQAGIVNSAFIVNKAVDRYAVLDAKQRKVSFRSFISSDFEGDVSLTDEELQTYYTENESSYLSEEQVKVKYIRISLADLAKQVVVTDAELESAYQSYLAALSADEKREISHILFADGENKEAEAQEALNRLAAGESFSDLATELSDDPGSAEFGGSLGELIPDVYVTEFYDAAVALSTEGEVSGLVETQFGVHLIRLDVLSTAQSATIEEKTADLTADIKDRNARDEMLLVESQLADAAFASDDIAEVAESFQADVVESDWLTRSSNNELISEAKVGDAIFSAQVIDDGLISDVIRTASGDLITVQKSEYQPEAVKAFDVVADDITAALTRVRANELMLQALSDAIDNTSELGEGWAEAVIVDRSNTELPSAVVQKAFELSSPDESGLSIGKVEGADTAYVVAVLDIIVNDPSESQRESASSFVTQVSGGAQYQIMFNQVRGEAKIKIRP